MVGGKVHRKIPQGSRPIFGLPPHSYERILVDLRYTVEHTFVLSIFASVMVSSESTAGKQVEQSDCASPPRKQVELRVSKTEYPKKSNQAVQRYLSAPRWPKFVHTTKTSKR